MAVGGFAVDGPGGGFKGKITVSVVITCIVAASSGLIFGYDIGISGTYSIFARNFRFFCCCFFDTCSFSQKAVLIVSLQLRWLLQRLVGSGKGCPFLCFLFIYLFNFINHFMRPFQRGMGHFCTSCSYILHYNFQSTHFSDVLIHITHFLFA